MENRRILCESEDLKILDPFEMIIINWDERLTSLTTGMTIEVGDSTVTCKNTDILKTDLDCIRYLRNIAKKSNRIFPTSMPEFFGAYEKYKQTTRNVKVNTTHLYLDDTNTGTFACVGDTKPLSEVDMIETGLKNNFYSTLGKIIFGKLSNLELDIFSIFDTLIELSSESLLDPSLKINEMTYTEMGTKILMYLPIPMPPCTENKIVGSANPQPILDGLEEYISENKEIEFFEFIKKLIRTHMPPLSRLELTKTYIIILNFYIRTTNRIRGFQISEGTATYQEKPWQILWSSSISERDLVCYCDKILNKKCGDRTLKKLYNLLSRDKLTSMTDLVYTLNLGETFIPKKSKITERKKFSTKISSNNNVKDLKEALLMNKRNFDSNNINRPQQDQFTQNNLMDSTENRPNIEILQDEQYEQNNVINNQNDMDYNIPIIDGDDTEEPLVLNRNNRNALEREQLKEEEGEEQIIITQKTKLSATTPNTTTTSTSNIQNTTTITLFNEITMEGLHTTTSVNPIPTTPFHILNMKTTSSTTIKPSTTKTTTTRMTPIRTTSKATSLKHTSNPTTTTSIHVITTTSPRISRNTIIIRPENNIRTTTNRVIRTTSTTTTKQNQQITTVSTTESTDSGFDYEINIIDDQGEMDSLISRRIRRSFVSYWLSSMTGLAEQNELEQMKRFENELLERENTLGNTFGNLTIQDQELTKRIQNISEKMTKSLADEQQINEQITKIISSQISGEQNVNKILGILDKNIKKNEPTNSNNDGTNIFGENSRKIQTMDNERSNGQTRYF